MRKPSYTQIFNFFSQVYIWNVIDSVMDKIKVVQWTWNYFKIAVTDMCAKYLLSKRKYFISLMYGYTWDIWDKYILDKYWESYLDVISGWN